MTTELLLHCDGANGSTTFVDAAGKTLNGRYNTTVSTEQSKFGGASAKFTGSMSWIEFVANPAFALGDTFTIELWFYSTSLAAVNGLFLIGDRTSNSNRLQLSCGSDGAVSFYASYGSADAINLNSAAGLVTTGVWYHLAVVRQGAVARLYLNGVKVAEQTSGLLATQSFNTKAHVGVARWGGALRYITGFVDEVRVLKGEAAYTADFTPPTEAFEMPLSSGALSLPVRVYIGPAAALSLPLKISLGPAGSVAIPFLISVVPVEIYNGSSPVSCGGYNHSPAPGYGEWSAAIWRPVVTLDGVDVTGDVVGSIEVEPEEDAARIATFSCKLAPGIPLTLPAWVGRMVTIDYARLMADGSALYPMRLFTGVVDTPDFAPATGTISLTCTDDLQGVCEAMTDAQIDELVGGRWSPHVFDAIASVGWKRIKDRVSTLPASVDLDPYRSPRLSLWHSGAAPLVSTAHDVEDDSLSVSFAGRSELVNQVDINFTYRYQRLNVAHNMVSYDVLAASGLSFEDYLRAGHSFMTKSSAAGAISSAGGGMGSVGYHEVPPTGVYDGLAWIANDAICLGYSGWIHTPYGHYIDERHLIRVEAPLAVAQVGPKLRTMSSALEGVSQGVDTWEERAWLSGSGTNVGLQPVDVIGPDGNSIDATTSTGTSREAANEAMMTLVDMAKTQIAASHRKNTVTYTVPLNPALDLDKARSVIAEGVSATGKVKKLRHVMEPDTGRAVTEVTLAISSLSGTGITHPDTPTAPPEEPAVTEKPVAPVTLTASTNFEFEQNTSNRVTITLPGVPEESRKDKVIELRTTFDAQLIEDEFTITT